MEREKERTAVIDERAYERLQAENEALKEKLARMERELLTLDSHLSFVTASRTYRLAQKMDKVCTALAPAGSLRHRAVRGVWRRLKSVMRISGERQHFAANGEQRAALRGYGTYKRMDVVTMQHTMYVARLVKRALLRLSIDCRIHIGEPQAYQDIPYVIICPQFVRTFPKVYFAVQLEQTVSSRWFTQEYVRTLENACAVLDYSLANVDYFQQPQNRALSKSVYYLPIDYHPNYDGEAIPKEKEYDVVFYGDAKNLRRQRILEAVSKRFKVKVCEELYGEDVYREIRKAKVLLNIHYYDGALLETTRLYETLSLNSAVIVSEDSSDAGETDRLADFVDLVPVGDTDALMARIAYWVEHDEARRRKVRENQEKLERRANAFDFYFYRFLLAHDRIDFDTFYRLAGDYVQLPGDRLCLNLPESTQRRRSFDRDNRYGFACVPGLRHEQGWIGCAMSYKMIFTKALEQGLERVMICEDDVIFPEDFEERLGEIEAYLQTRAWSIFSGVMADVGRVQVMSCEQRGDVTFAEIDHMVSTVFNIYNRALFEHIRDWDPNDRDAQKNAIDRYLEKKKLSVHVQLPYLVGHKEELNSTIWGVSNMQYAQQIANSESQLRKLVQAYQSR